MICLSTRSAMVISLLATVWACNSKKKEYVSFLEYLVCTAYLTEMVYTPSETKLSFWVAPTAEDVSPTLNNDVGVIIYEMHHRDFFADDIASGITNRSKYLALAETGIRNLFGQPNGIDYLKELGVTHAQLLSSSDFASLDETTSDRKRYNWGYNPQNYNVPEGSDATDSYQLEIYICEFKQMVQVLHKAVLGL